MTKNSIKKMLPMVLAITGSVGVIATAVTAVRATPKALKAVEQTKEKKGSELTGCEIVKTAAPMYIPSLIICAATITCIIGSQLMTRKNQAALVSAYAVLSNSYKAYRDKVEEIFGEGADKKVSDGVAKDVYDAEKVFITPCDGLDDFDNSEKILFYDEMSQRYFEATPFAVHNAEYHLNRNFTLRGSANLSEFYEFLGLPTSEKDVVLGWDAVNGYEWIDFIHDKITLDDGLECCVLSAVFEPELNLEAAE